MCTWAQMIWEGKQATDADGGLPLNFAASQARKFSAEKMEGANGPTCLIHANRIAFVLVPRMRRRRQSGSLAAAGSHWGRTPRTGGHCAVGVPRVSWPRTF